MPVETKKPNTLLLWAGALGLALIALVVIALCLPQKAEQPQLQTTQTTTETTQVTLPPPQANPYGPMDFQYDGKYLTCLAGESVLGIDVSSHQQTVDWQQVADAGIRFVMLRVGYRGYESGELQADALVQENYLGAKAAGLQVGAYFFSQALSTEEALEEAEYLLSAIRDWELDMPVVYDWEYIDTEARTGNSDARTVTDCTIAFCQAVEAAGYQPMVYFNRHHAQEYLYLEELTRYPFWLALYSDRMTYPYQVDMWQYTSQGHVPGIEGDVDINLLLPS